MKTRRKLAIVFAVLLLIFGLGAALMAYLLNQQILAYVSVTKADLRSMGFRVEEYYAKHGKYPDAVPMPRRTRFASAQQVRALGANNLKMIGLGEDHGFQDLYTNLPFVYHVSDRGWLLYSAGPNLKYDISPSEDYEGYTSTSLQKLIPKIYDPTNGFRSSGDIVAIKSSTYTVKR